MRENKEEPLGQNGEKVNEDQILCACSAYEQKYYLNPKYSNLPTQIQEELQIMAVTLTEDVGGIFTMEFDEDGNLYLSTSSKENDFFYDEIKIVWIIIRGVVVTDKFCIYNITRLVTFFNSVIIH